MIFIFINSIKRGRKSIQAVLNEQLDVNQNFTVLEISLF